MTVFPRKKRDNVKEYSENRMLQFRHDEDDKENNTYIVLDVLSEQCLPNNLRDLVEIFFFYRSTFCITFEDVTRPK